MEHSTSVIVGNPNDFAITYSACPESYGYEVGEFGILSLIINNHRIGREDNASWLGPWVYHLTDRKKRIDTTRHLLFPTHFEKLSNREIFETILKANQFEEEFNQDFLYLPRFDDSIWSKHGFDIYETTDGYSSFFYVKDDKITFLIEDNIEELEERGGKFIFHSVTMDYFLKTIDEFVDLLVGMFPVLKESISKREFNF